MTKQLCVASVALGGLCLASEVRGDAVPADSSNIQYSDVARVTLSAGQAGFDRIINDEPIYNLRYDNPGARVRFRTDATNISADLYYNGLHAGCSAIEGTGVILRDGQPVGTFTSSSRPGAVTVSLPSQATPEMHDYELVMPYADSVDFKQLNVNTGASFATPAARPTTRYVAYGDSITQGYFATDALHNYPSLLGAAKGWETVNMGFGGRKATASDGTVIGSLNADVITMMIGFNDAAQGRPVSQYTADLEGTIQNIRAEQPDVPIYLISPIWTSAADLTSFRQAVAGIVIGMDDANLHFVDGLTLVPNDPAYFPDGVHPNNAGLAFMAQNLENIVSLPEPALAPMIGVGSLFLSGRQSRRRR